VAVAELVTVVTQLNDGSGVTALYLPRRHRSTLLPSCTSWLTTFDARRHTVIRNNAFASH